MTRSGESEREWGTKAYRPLLILPPPSPHYCRYSIGGLCRGQANAGMQKDVHPTIHCLRDIPNDVTIANYSHISDIDVMNTRIHYARATCLHVRQIPRGIGA